MTSAMLIYSNLFCEVGSWLFPARKHAVGDRGFSFEENDQHVCCFLFLRFFFLNNIRN